ncbi:ABC-3 protein [Arcobacter nitrofigilis DSM 7299]|uniref:ABC-3 protein n=1 Tax=Arcobacter nitrofigilis (strain ATCC 33309 / DSM 7299 / CCUG 15893 / LMG 7604 / NCTC 12251 / CI) TaxID=572480 RepID=D5V2B1_ARCNC|nr:metal ABC transporter permease [Arcobacter nitrofigilis]ADG92344.1 ABC-3 protein [Arcobacter nitrofigilis DSM 7299]|tara:strand:- start:588 stop:1397 length:810 start_codon:yes stop_codon:yes gene_type:complete
MEIFEYAFMIRAFVAGIFIAILAPTLGTFVVVRRYSMLSDSLAHISLLGVALGFLFSISTTFSAIIIALLASLFIEYLRKNHNIYSDSILSIFLSSALALAIIIVSISNSFNVALFSYLFGSIVAVSKEDIWTICIFGVLSALFIINNYQKLLFVAFDEEVAKASGINVSFLNYMLVSLVAITVGLSIKIIGVLLIGALMIMPVISAMQFEKSFFITCLLAVSFAVLAVIVGLFVSFYISLPSGATIVVVSLILFILSLMLKINKKRAL